MSSYQYPPINQEEAEEWAYHHETDAIAYAAGWTGSGHGYGEQALAEWPECTGFDWEEGLPDWDCGLSEEEGYEYRTVLCRWLPGLKDPAGWERVASYSVNPEPELYDLDGNISGHVYLGEGAAEVVFKRKDEEA